MIKDAFLGLGPLAGVLGIALAIGARRHTTRVVAECADLIQGRCRGLRGAARPF